MSDVKDVIGEKLVNVVEKEDEVALFFEEHVVVVKLPWLDTKCIGCYKNGGE